MIAIKRYIEHFGLSRDIIFTKEKCFRVCGHLVVVVQSEINRTDFILFGNLRRCPHAEVFRQNFLQIWRPIPLYLSSSVKSTSDILRASLNNLSKDYWHFCIKLNTC